MSAIYVTGISRCRKIESRCICWTPQSCTTFAKYANLFAKTNKNPRISPRADACVRFTKQSRKYGVEVLQYAVESVADSFFLGLSWLCPVCIRPKLLLGDTCNLLEGSE